MNRNETLRLVAPYAVWMILMMALPSTAVSYAVRTFATTVLLVFSLWGSRAALELKGVKSRSVFLGLLVGLVIAVAWIAPDNLSWYRRLFILGDEVLDPATGSPFDPTVCGWPLTVVRLLGSALVISVAEELFFRRWLTRFAGFWGMVFLFALEHDRWLLGAVAGVAYGGLYLRCGLLSAILAHALTNLLLGLWVIYQGAWAFW